jgi:hypothetical protein
MSGTAADPVVNAGGQIPQTIVVGANGQITLTVPNNRTGANEHGRGYVVYAEALPDATVTFIGEQGVIDPDPASFPDSLQRLNPITVLTGDSFEIRLETAPGDPLDPNTDDNALFAWDQRNRDWNGNGVLDIPFTTSVIGGYEEFLTFKRPLYNSANATGLYRQTIDATQMDEGMHYLSVIAFRHRPAGSTPIFREVRKVVYIDRLPPEIELVQAGQSLTDARPEFAVRGLDRTVRRVHMFVDLAPGTDPVALCDTSNQIPPYDRNEWRRILDPTLSHGFHEITVVAFEDTDNHTVLRESVFIDLCTADFNKDGLLNFFDISAFIAAFNAQDPDADLAAPFGTFNFFDLAEFISLYNAGCP